MPGRRITLQQIGLYMRARKLKHTQEASAARAGFSVRSVPEIEKRGRKPAKPVHNWKTRKDPFEDVWDSKLVPLLEKTPHLQAVTLLEILQEEHEGAYPDHLLRTLQRRVKKWRALSGPSKEVIFRQNHPPGDQGLSDFTCMNELKITIAEETFEHMLYHYRLPFSGWEYAEVVLGGESFTALTEKLQNALWQCGGAPKTHRTDNLSAAVKNLSNQDKKEFTDGYEEFCSHYQMEPTRNNPGVSHENGSIESSHGHLKSKVDQALLVRGSRDFPTLSSYQDFLRKIVGRHNQRIHKKHLEELSCLQPLPERKTMDYTEKRVCVTSSSTFSLKGVVYSVPSRLINETLKVHIYDDRLECYVGGALAITLQRKRCQKGHARQIDYRHLVEHLSRKPGAFRNYIHKENFFPTLAFRQTWEHLEAKHPSRTASKEYIAILKEGAKQEQKVSQFLEKLLLEGKEITSQKVQDYVSPPSQELPQKEIGCESLSVYSNLIRRSL